jgi:hypothetical protein
MIRFIPQTITFQRVGSERLLLYEAGGPITYNETGREITVVAVLTGTDRADFFQTDKLITAVIVLAATDGKIYSEVNRTFTAIIVLSETDAIVQAIQERNREIVIVCVVGKTEVARFVQTPLVVISTEFDLCHRFTPLVNYTGDGTTSPTFTPDGTTSPTFTQEAAVATVYEDAPICPLP